MKHNLLKMLKVLFVTGTLFIHANLLYAQTGSNFQLSANSQGKLSAVQQLMQQNEYQQALQILNELLKSVQNKKYDQAVVYQTFGYVYSGLNNYKESSDSFIKAVKLRSLPKSIVHELNYSIAQLLIHQGSYKEGLKYITDWFRQEKKPSAEGHHLAATAYYHDKNYKQLVFQARSAIAKRNPAPSSWYDLLLAGYYETNDMPKAAELMEKMLKLFPDKDDYWMQLAGIYLSIKQEKNALALMELAYTKELLRKHDELLSLARTYLYLDMPYKAAELISGEIKKQRIKKDKETMVLLADSWLLAQERSKGIETIVEAVASSNDTQLRYRLGQLYVDQEEWTKAISELNKVVINSKFAKIGDAYLLLGIAYYEHKDNIASYKALNKALSYDKTNQQAQQWLAQLKSGR